MKKNKTVILGFLCMIAFVLGGCVRIESSFSVDQDNKVTVGVEEAFHKEKTDARLMEEEGMTQQEMEQMLSDFEVKTIQGEEYYVAQESHELTEEELEENYPEYIINKDKFYMYSAMEENPGAGEDGDDIFSLMTEMGISPKDLEYIAIQITLPSEVVKTNGVLQEDKQTVVWDVTSSLFSETDDLFQELYAYTANDPGDPDADRLIVEKQTADPFASYHPGENPMSSVNPSIAPTQAPSISASPMPTPQNKVTPPVKKKTDQQPPVIKGAKNNKSYKKGVTLYVKDNKQIKKVTVNGKKVKLKKIVKGKYKGYYKFTVKKKGTYTAVAIDTSGNRKKIKFRIK